VDACREANGCVGAENWGLREGFRIEGVVFGVVVDFVAEIAVESIRRFLGRPLRTIKLPLMD
jgi:hypothetical protein